MWSAEDERDLLATIEESADRLDSLIGNLLDLSRLQSGAITPLFSEVDLAGVVEWALGPIAGAEAVRVTDQPRPADRAAPTPACWTGWSPTWWRTRSSTPRPVRRSRSPARSGRSSGGAGCRSGWSTTAAACPPHPWTGCSRRSSGWVTYRQGDGLGLGLAVARGLTEAMGGTVSAEETPGGGLTVVIDLPAGEPDPQPEPAPPADQAVPA